MLKLLRSIQTLLLGDRGPEVDDAGLVQWSRMDDAFRVRCAVWGNGRCVIAEGYSGDMHVRTVLLDLKRTGVVPGGLREEVGTLSEIAAAWSGEDGGEVDTNPEMVERLLRLFAEAAKARAADVVFEMGSADCRVFAIVNDRKFAVGAPLALKEAKAMTGFIFWSRDEGSRQTGWQRQSFQGFSVRPSRKLPLAPQIASLRCQRGPHEPDGDHLFCRMFYREMVSKDMTLEGLGFGPDITELFREIRMSKHGGIFVGGITGDGKSTTLVVNLRLQMKEHDYQLNMVTLEDPVEYPVEGAIQIAVPTTGVGKARKEHYRSALMHFVRLHPASGMVSEIRDVMGAQQSLQFIDSGHQIWTTLHVHSANSILFRLMDLGVTPAEVTKKGNVRLLMKQTLLPLLCPKCSTPKRPEGLELPEALAGLLGSSVRYRNREGCAYCRKVGDSELSIAAWAGYLKQIAVAETIVPDDGYMKFVRKRNAIGAWNYWVNELGGVPVAHKIWRAVAQGRVDPSDAMRKGAQVVDAVEILGALKEAAPANGAAERVVGEGNGANGWRGAGPGALKRIDEGLVEKGRVLEGRHEDAAPVGAESGE